MLEQGIVTFVAVCFMGLTYILGNKNGYEEGCGRGFDEGYDEGYRECLSNGRKAMRAREDYRKTYTNKWDTRG